jgi:hypothetical protein
MCVANYNHAYRTANKVRIADLKKLWTLENKERKAACDKEYAKANPEARKLARKKWATANKGLVNSYTKKRRADQMCRTPIWLTDIDKERMQNEYKLSALLTKLTNESWHVDHIIPLQGKTVSGLHTPSNLRVMKGVENISKGNSYAF